MIRSALVPVLLAAAPAAATDGDDFDPAKVEIVDAINCHLDVPSYHRFAWALSGEEQLATRLAWRQIESPNPFLAEYDLPHPVLVTGTWSTRRIAFSTSGVMAILDLADPAVVAGDEGIVNEVDSDAAVAEIASAAQVAGVATREELEAETPFRKFLGQRVLADVTEPANDADWTGTRTVIARSISNVTSHPGKTLYGCSYRIELLGRDGKPL